MRFSLNLLVGIMVLSSVLAVSAPQVHGATPTPLMISEIMYDPLTSEVGGEWVELYNNGSQPINVFNWTMSDQDGGVDFIFPDILFPAWGLALVHTGSGLNSSSFINGKAEFFMWKTSSIWSPTADDCLLSNSTGHTMDYISYGQWNGSSLDPPPGDFNYTHSNSTAREGFTLAIAGGRLRESVPTPLEVNGQDDAQIILITEVYYDTWGENEYCKLHNPGLMPVNISHWQLTDGEGIATFPPASELGPGEWFIISQNSTNFERHVLEIPDFEYWDEDPAVPEMIMIGTEPKLVNDGDELFLLNQFGTHIDAFIYGDSSYSGLGWAGSPAPDLKQGQFAKRNLQTMYIDTNTSEDWQSPRPFVIGQSDFHPVTYSGVSPMLLFTSPDSSFGAVCEVLDNATESICLNLYEFTNTMLCDRLLGAIGRGVSVRLFVEGSPVGGINQTQLFIMRQIVEAGGFVRILTNDPDNDIHVRYDYDHGKYAVIDDEILVIMSENWGWTGVPPTGWYGNRGWGAAISDMGLAGYFKEVFEDDWNPLRTDSVLFNSSHNKWDLGHNWSSQPGNCDTHFERKLVFVNAQVTPVLCPDTSLSNETILGALNSASERVYVEQFYIYKHWGDKDNGTTATDPNPYLEAVIDAARRGCEVRVLMDASYYNADPDDPIDNDDTAEYINEIAMAESLDLEAKLVNAEQHDFGKIHNKGLIADDKVLISSINWNENSATENRETGVIIESSQAAEFFVGVFEYDWMDDTTPPVASFSSLASYPTNRTHVVNASNSYDNEGIVNYSWALDGTPAGWGVNFTFNFTEPGVHILNLTVSDEWGNSGHVQHSIIVVDESEPEQHGEDETQASEDDSMAQILAIMLLVPLFVFVAVIVALYLRNR